MLQDLKINVCSSDIIHYSFEACQPSLETLLIFFPEKLFGYWFHISQIYAHEKLCVCSCNQPNRFKRFAFHESFTYFTFCTFENDANKANWGKTKNLKNDNFKTTLMYVKWIFSKLEFLICQFVVTWTSVWEIHTGNHKLNVIKAV